MTRNDNHLLGQDWHFLIFVICSRILQRFVYWSQEVHTSTIALIFAQNSNLLIALAEDHAQSVQVGRWCRFSFLWRDKLSVVIFWLFLTFQAITLVAVASFIHVYGAQHLSHHQILTHSIIDVISNNIIPLITFVVGLSRDQVSAVIFLILLLFLKDAVLIENPVDIRVACRIYRRYAT